MGRLLLIRHGESEGNRDRVFTHTPEVPLTEAGRAQVRAAADWLAVRYRPAAIVSSPFLRARQTADIVAGRFVLPVRVEEDLREQSYGELAGQPYASLRDCTDYEPTRYWLWRPPGGETLEEVAARAGAALDRVVALEPSADQVVVSHGGVMMALWRHVTGEWRRGRVAPNAGLVVVEHEGGRYRTAAVVEDV